jgi:hypothetical protein
MAADRHFQTAPLEAHQLYVVRSPLKITTDDLQLTAEWKILVSKVMMPKNQKAPTMTSSTYNNPSMF